MSNHLKLIRAFPKALLDDVLVISKYLESKKIKIHESSQCEVLIHHEHIVVPSRIYITQLQCIEFHNFSLTQRQILWCILTRHHNGFVRQRALERLIKTDLTSFMIPFIFQLLGEYVQEILEAIEPILDANNQELFAAFMLQNPKYDQICCKIQNMTKRLKVELSAIGMSIIGLNIQILTILLVIKF